MQIFLVFIFSFLSFVTEVNCSEWHRVPDQEGWNWAGPFRYSFKDTKLDFTDPHATMRIQEGNLRVKLGLKKKTELDQQPKKGKNICLARFSFVVEATSGESDGFPKRVHLYSISEDLNGPLEKHVFISGLKVPNKNFSKSKPSKGKSTYKHSFRYNDEPEGSDEVFIHPNEYSLNMDEVINRLNRRYEGVDEGELLQLPRLARNWEQLRDDTGSEKDECVIQWFEEANSTFGHPTEEKQSIGVFFTQNEDSEQKLLYYLDYITDCLDEVDWLTKLVERVKKFAQSRPQYLSGKIREMMTIKKSRESTERASISNILLSLRNSPPEDQEILYTSINDLIKILQEKRGKDRRNPHLKVLTTCAVEVRSIFESLLETERENIYTKSCEALEELDKIIGNQREDVLKVDPTITNFKKSLKQVLNPENVFISAIVLNIHNTYDSCFSCAPDLARESLRVNGFVNYFKSLVAKHNPNGHQPFFRIISSCGQIRTAKWCGNCTNSPPPYEELLDVELNLDNPLLGPIYPTYYQHIFPSEERHCSYKRGDLGVDEVADTGEDVNEIPEGRAPFPTEGGALDEERNIVSEGGTSSPTDRNPLSAFTEGDIGVLDEVGDTGEDK